MDIIVNMCSTGWLHVLCWILVISQYTMDTRNLVQIRQICKSSLKVNQLRMVNTVVLDNINALGKPPTLCTGPAVVDLMANHAKVVNNSYDRDFLLRRSDMFIVTLIYIKWIWMSA